jgi:PAS domain S-box-containing protein
LPTGDMEFTSATSNTEITDYKTKMNPFKILVVDDDSFILDLFRHVISHINMDYNVQSKIRGSNENFSSQNTPNLPSLFDIVTCHQADEAVDVIKDSLKCGQPFSITFVDVRMPPGPDGVWAAEQIRALDPNIEIVIMSGYKDISPGVIARRVPPLHKLLYIQKPLKSHEIIQFTFALSMKWYGEYKLQEVNEEIEAQIEKQIQRFEKIGKKIDGIENSVTDYMSIIDEAYNIVWTSRAGKKVFGEHMVGKKCYQVYYRREEPCQHCMVQKTFSDGLAREQDKELIGKNGNKIFFRCLFKLTKRNQEGREKRVVAIFKDINELKQVEKKLRKLNDTDILRYQNKSKMLSQALKKLEEKEKDLSKYKSDLERLKKEAEETSLAFSVLARNIDKDKKVFEKKIYSITTIKILPIIKSLKKNKSCQRIIADLDVLETNVNSLYSFSNNDHEIINILTDQEMRVATLIKRGLTSQKISDMLCISEDTVKTHRKNIRKKLKIQNSNINLISYLKSNMPSDLIRKGQAPVHGPDLQSWNLSINS